MENKNNKELAVEAAIEFTKSWNSADRTKPLASSDFTDIIKEVYKTLNSLDD